VTTPTVTDPPALLTPTDDLRPAQLAVVSSIAGQHDPETFLVIVFPLPDGGLRIRYAWTAGGVELGDRIDREALARGLDCADHAHITDLHQRRTWRGRVRIDAHPLRPVLADVTAGVRCDETRRAGIRRLLEVAAQRTGRTPQPGVPRWLGVGPELLNRKTP
jgi:hypothetical protein